MPTVNTCIRIAALAIIAALVIAACSKNPPPPTPTSAPVATPILSTTPAAPATTPAPTLTPVPTPSPSPSPLTSPSPATPPPGTPAPVAQTRAITITDSDLPPPPIPGIVFHLAPPSGPNDFGPGKITARLFGQSWSVWMGVDDGKVWLYHVLKPDPMPDWLARFYDSLGINQYTTVDANGYHWIQGIPPWIDIAKYDKDVTALPTIVSIATGDGTATITYSLAGQ